MTYGAEIITALIVLAYLCWIFFLLKGWFNKLVIPEQKPENYLTLSVVIAFRNEEKNLENLCRDLLNLSYDPSCFELIFVNDHSEDSGVEIIQSQLSGKADFRIIYLGKEKTGKKAALREGISAARYDWIVTTDADCRVPVRWLELLASAQEAHRQVMWCGRVFYTGKTFWDNLLQHEFSSVIGTGAATLQLGKPTMCNGANLAFDKKSFYEVGGYSGTEQLASGDDEFLMHKLFQSSHGKVGFLNHAGHSIYTPGPATIGAFFQQRMRWGSKWQHYQNGFVKRFAFVTFLLQFALLVLPLASLAGWVPWFCTGIAWSVKILIDGLFIHTVMKDFERRINFFILLCIEVIYPFYVVLIGILSRFSSYSWKGRKLK